MATTPWWLRQIDAFEVEWADKVVGGVSLMRIGVYPQVFEDRELGEREGREVGSSQWVKKSGPPFEESGREFDYHWYEHPEVGRVEVKRKEIA